MHSWRKLKRLKKHKLKDDESQVELCRLEDLPASWFGCSVEMTEATPVAMRPTTRQQRARTAMRQSFQTLSEEQAVPLHGQDHLDLSESRLKDPSELTVQLTRELIMQLSNKQFYANTHFLH